MKVTVNQKNLKKVLWLVEKIVSKNPALPILNNILIKTDSGRLKVSSTNLEIGINCMIGAKIDEVGEIAVPARVVSDFINNVSDEKITLNTKNNTLSINSDKYKTQILGFDSKDFPIIPKLKDKPAAVISSKVLKSMLFSVADSMAVSATRPELSGVYIELGPKNMIFAATDSFRLSETIFNTKNSDQHSVIVPRSTVMELIRITSEIDGDMEIKIVIPAVLKNDPFEISVNYHYLLDGLKIIDSEKVLLEFTGNGNPVIVKPHDNNKDLTYLIMPLRS